MAKSSEDIERNMLATVKACLLGIQDLNFGDFACCSGFIFEDDGDWFWITAGHAIEHFERWHEECGEISFWFRSPVFPEAVSLNHSATKAISVRALALAVEAHQPPEEPWQKELMSHFRSADIGIMRLPSETKSELSSLGSVPFTRANVRLYGFDEIKTEEINFGGPVVLAGLPGNSRYARPSVENPTGFFKTLCVELVGEDALRVFFKQAWEEADHMGSVAGMSGGPIVFLGWTIPIVLGVQADELQPQEVSASPDLTLIGFQFSKLLETVFPLVQELWQN